MDFHDHVAQIEKILGVTIRDDVIDFSIKVDLSSAASRKKALTDVRLKQKALRHVKRDITYSISQIKRDYQNKTTLVGSGFWSSFTRVFAGARAAGRYNALTRADLRNDKVEDVQPYERLKDVVDQLLYELDCAKAKIA
jgi:hypothetical protein